MKEVKMKVPNKLN